MGLFHQDYDISKKSYYFASRVFETLPCLLIGQVLMLLCYRWYQLYCIVFLKLFDEIKYKLKCFKIAYGIFYLVAYATYVGLIINSKAYFIDDLEQVHIEAIYPRLFCSTLLVIVNLLSIFYASKLMKVRQMLADNYNMQINSRNFTLTFITVFTCSMIRIPIALIDVIYINQQQQTWQRYLLQEGYDEYVTLIQIVMNILFEIIPVVFYLYNINPNKTEKDDQKESLIQSEDGSYKNIESKITAPYESQFLHVMKGEDKEDFQNKYFSNNDNTIKSRQEYTYNQGQNDTYLQKTINQNEQLFSMVKNSPMRGDNVKDSYYAQENSGGKIKNQQRRSSMMNIGKLSNSGVQIIRQSSQIQDISINSNGNMFKHCQQLRENLAESLLDKNCLKISNYDRAEINTGSINDADQNDTQNENQIDLDNSFHSSISNSSL